MSIIVTRKLKKADVIVVLPPPPTGSPEYQELAFSDNPISGGGAASYRSANNTYLGGYIPGVYAGNAVGGLRWNNIGGDWKDANGIDQGDAPLASLAVTSGGAHYVDWSDPLLLAKIKSWVGGSKNYGFFLRSISGTGVAGFNTRFAPSNPPILALTTTSLGIVNVPCARSQWLTTAQTSAIINSATSHVQGTSDYLILWFDLSAFTSPADITAAHLRVWSYTQAGGGCTVGVFEIWNPGDLGDIDTQTLGVANSYPFDVNLASDDSILFAERFDDAAYTSRFSFVSPDAYGDYVTTPNPATGFTLLPGTTGAIMCHFDPGDNANSNTGWLNIAWSPWRDSGLHVKTPDSYDELYSRYYVFLGTDWNPIPDGGKFPGWDGRFGYGFDQQPIGPVHPNGTIAGMGNGNGGTGCDGYTGYSVRGAYERTSIGTPPPNPGDPLFNGAWLDYGDVYNLSQPGDIGTGNKSFGNLSDWGRHYLGWLRRGQWYCIDQYLKLNSVTTRAPQSITSITSVTHPTSSGCLLCTATLAAPDTLMQTGEFKWISGAVPAEYNNQGGSYSSSTNGGRVGGMHCGCRITVLDSTHFTYVINTSGVALPSPATGTITAKHNIANADGVTRVWINGHFVNEKTDWRFRYDTLCTDGTTPYGIDYWWANLYFGGADTIITGGHVYFAAVAVGTSYIGPMSAAVPLPTWLTAVGNPLLTWIAVNNVSVNGSKISTMTDMSLIVNAGLTNPDYSDVANIPAIGSLGPGTRSYSGSRQKIFDYSGGALKVDGSEMLVFGGGGAGAWPGNDIRGFRLEDDVPTWRVRTTPTEAFQATGSGHWSDAAGTGNYWTETGNITSHQYLRNGQPNGRHAYRQLQFDDAANRAWLFGASNVWEYDTSTFYGVDSIPLQTGVPWTVGTDNAHAGTAAYTGGTYPNIAHLERNFGWILKNTNTNEIYYPGASSIYAFSLTTHNAWTRVMDHTTHPAVPTVGVSVAIAAYDSNHNRILRIAWSVSANGSGATHSTVDLSGAKAWTNAVLTDTGSGYATNITNNNSNGCGLVYDPVLDKYLYFMDDGKIYTITYVNDATYTVDILAMTNPASAPVVNASRVHGTLPATVSSRMQYIPNLKGVCIVQAYNQPVYFVRTS